jgi:hypothetical protein
MKLSQERCTGPDNSFSTFLTNLPLSFARQKMEDKMNNKFGLDFPQWSPAAIIEV